MRRLLLPTLVVLSTLAPLTRAPAQEGPPVVSVRLAAPRRAVYVAAMEALERGGYTLRMRFLDETLVTLPAFSTPNPGAEETASVVGVEIAEAGDSTQLTIHAAVVRGDGRPVDVWRDQGALAVVLAAEVLVSAAVDSALGRLAPGDGKPDRREETDVYAYGRLNPVRVGGQPGAGVAAQRRYLDGLRGPAGEPVRYRRLGSCCEFRTRAAGRRHARRLRGHLRRAREPGGALPRHVHPAHQPAAATGGLHLRRGARGDLAAAPCRTGGTPVRAVLSPARTPASFRAPMLPSGVAEPSRARSRARRERRSAIRPLPPRI